MLKIKVFDCEDEKDLTNELNDFIEDIYKQDKEVIDIKYSTSIAINDEEQIYCYSALVMYDDKIVKQYKPKRYEILEKVEDNALQRNIKAVKYIDENLKRLSKFDKEAVHLSSVIREYQELREILTTFKTNNILDEVNKEVE